MPFRLAADEWIHGCARRRRDGGGFRVEIENLAVGETGLRARPNAEVLPQQRRALLIEVQRRGPLPAPRVTTHEGAPRLFVERIETEQLLGVFDRIIEGPIRFEQRDQSRENLLSALPQTFAVGLDPFARAGRQQIALVQTGGFLQRTAAVREAAVCGALEARYIDGR